MSPVSPALAALARTHLASALSSLPAGPKHFFVDDTLYVPATSSSHVLSLFTTAQYLSSHSIAQVRALSTFSLHAPTLSSASSVFLLRPSAAAARHVAAALAHTPPERALVLVTPRRSRLVERILTASIARGTVRVAVLPLGFLPFDDGIVTLGWPAAFREVVLEGNNHVILAAAAALKSLADVGGVDFVTIRTAGAAAQATVDEYLSLAGRRVHGMQVRQGAASAFGAEKKRSSIGGDWETRAAHGDDSMSDGSGDSSTIASLAGSPSASAADFEPLAASLFPGTVSVAQVLAGKHLKGSGSSGGDGGGVGSGSVVGSPVSPVSDVSGLRHYRRRPVKLVVLDRNVDVVTPLLTQWTYEGLLDEAVGLLRGNVLDIGVNEFKSQDASGMLVTDARATGPPGGSGGASTSSRRVQKRLRCEGDAIFGQLRDLNYWAAARLLGSVASSVQAYYDARPGRDTAEIGQVKDYVRGLREVKSEHRSAAVHTAIAAEVSARTFEQAVFKRRFELEREMLEGNSAGGRRAAVHESIARSEPLPHVLRLLCLWSVTGGGVDAEAFDFLRREVVATYGLTVLSLLGNLERAGLLTRSARLTSSGGMPWSPFVKFGLGGGNSGDAAGDGSGDGDGSSAGKSKGDSGGGGGGAQQRRNSSSLPASGAVVGYSWQFVRAAMQLVTDFEPEALDNGGVSGPFSGYVPLTLRLIEAGVSESGWDKLPRIAAHTLLLPAGHTVNEWSVKAGNISRGEDDFGTVDSAPFDPAGLGDIDCVILFVGGITRAEASAVRAGASKRGERIIIATTDVFGANQFVLMS